MKLFLDITRIAYRITGTTPTGIDRVEFAYANRLLRDPAYGGSICIFTAPFFTGALRRDMMLGVLDRIERAWRLDMRAEQDRIYLALLDHLGSPVVEGRVAQRRFRHESRVGHLRKHMIYPMRDLFRSPTRLRRWQSRTATADAVYLNTSHNQLEAPQRLVWANRSNMRSVFFIHDTIPIDYPEFVAPVSCGRHERRMMTTSSMASLVIVNSTATKRRIESFLSGAGLRVPDINIVPLGVADAFIRVGAEMRGRPIQGPQAHPYFVTLSTIEPRKNLLFLFTVWRRLIERLGPRTPRLVVAGARGWENENIADVLERSRELGPYLVEVSDLCDDALARLLSGAKALLQPSSIEGFGLPLIEGLTLGLPVVASDIAAHREVASGYADFIDPIDGLRWLDTIEALADTSSGLADRKRKANAAYVPTTWRSHVDDAMAAIAQKG